MYSTNTSFRPPDASRVLNVLAPGQRRLGLLEHTTAGLNWPSLALGVYRDILGMGMRPSLGVLDKWVLLRVGETLTVLGV